MERVMSNRDLKKALLNKVLNVDLPTGWEVFFLIESGRVEFSLVAANETIEVINCNATELQEAVDNFRQTLITSMEGVETNSNARAGKARNIKDNI